MVNFNLASTSSSSGIRSIPSDDPADRCPVDHTTREQWLRLDTSTPRSPTIKWLPTDRVISSIPRGAPPSGSSVPLPVSPETPSSSSSKPSSSPPSSLSSSSSSSSSSATSSATSTSPSSSASPRSPPTRDASGNWVYPSEQQFFNAMLRKNHNPQAADMRTIVPIHNGVNEKAWEEVLAWEGASVEGRKCGGPRLISFSGKPTERTPKAWVNMALGYSPPFDRHDWLIDRCGTTVRYIIDFYTGRPDPKSPEKVGFYLDVRPALDSRAGVETRLWGWWNRA